MRRRYLRYSCTFGILTVCSLLTTACGSFQGALPQGPIWDRPECDTNQEQRATRLQASDALIGEPSGVDRVDTYRALPCEDEDGIGAVGWNGMLDEATPQTFRDYYRKKLPELGW